MSEKDAVTVMSRRLEFSATESKTPLFLVRASSTPVGSTKSSSAMVTSTSSSSPMSLRYLVMELPNSIWKVSSSSRTSSS